MRKISLPRLFFLSTPEKAGKKYFLPVKPMLNFAHRKIDPPNLLRKGVSA
jgi:hypothetical protein